VPAGVALVLPERFEIAGKNAARSAIPDSATAQHFFRTRAKFAAKARSGAGDPALCRVASGARVPRKPRPRGASVGQRVEESACFTAEVDPPVPILL
jgi:hypothetical protein